MVCREWQGIRQKIGKNGGRTEDRSLFHATVYNREGFARLLYRMAKIDGIWQVEAMDCIYERDFMVPVIPGTGRTFSKEEFAGYRRSYQCISWIFDHTGMPCSMDEAGDDKPETVEKLYREASAWLFKDRT